VAKAVAAMKDLQDPDARHQSAPQNGRPSRHGKVALYVVTTWNAMQLKHSKQELKFLKYTLDESISLQGWQESSKPPHITMGVATGRNTREIKRLLTRTGSASS
jgi:hypothetical protein